MRRFRPYYICLIASLFLGSLQAQDHSGHDHSNGHHDAEHATPKDERATAAEQADMDAHHDDHSGCGHHEDPNAAFNAGEVALHHVADANAVHIVGDLYFHLPIILYAPGHGWKVSTTGAFKAKHHGNGTVAQDGYVLVHGNVMRVQDPSFPKGEVAVSEPAHEEKEINGKLKTIYYVKANDICYQLDPKSTLDGGVLGGGITSFYDFSITRNVFTMLLVSILLFWLFRTVARSYSKREGQAPRGVQNFMEPIITFVRDDIAIPNIGPHYEKFLPYLMAIFFFILGLNLFGQIPFFPGSGNVTGSLSVTLVLAMITFFITNFNGNRHYWEHTFWMPGVPPVLKILIITPVEILGLFLKPFTLMLRLFANITSGHIMIVSFVSMIFIFGEATKSMGGTLGGTLTGLAISFPLTLFMFAIELLVAFLQAYIFTMLSAVYFGLATEEAHH